MCEALRKLIRGEPVGFEMDEVMTGTHRFEGGAGPAGELELTFRVTWGTASLWPYFDPRSPAFLSNCLRGTVTVGGLVENAVCAGKLDLRYFQEGKLRYTFDFVGTGGEPYHFVGEKVGIRPWNLHRTHTTCYGVITDAAGQVVSRSVTYFRLSAIPAFLRSFRLK